ncbi:MAG: MnhB domain-containing protein [Persicimonas sp.]
MSSEPSHTLVRRSLRGFVAVVLAALAAAGVWAIWTAPRDATGLLGPVTEHLEASGVESAVTATLLNFRAWDTLLEVTVLVLVLVGIWSLGERTAGAGAKPVPRLLEVARSLLTPVILVVAGYLLWAGARAPGGAFQAGAVAASAGILVLLVDDEAFALRPLVYRLSVVAGLLVFMAVGFGGLAAGGDFLAYPTGWAKGLILVVEAASAVSIAACLLGMFAGLPEKLLRDESET